MLWFSSISSERTICPQCGHFSASLAGIAAPCADCCGAAASSLPSSAFLGFLIKNFFKSSNFKVHSPSGSRTDAIRRQPVPLRACADRCATRKRLACAFLCFLAERPFLRVGSPFISVFLSAVAGLPLECFFFCHTKSSVRVPATCINDNLSKIYPRNWYNNCRL